MRGDDIKHMVLHSLWVPTNVAPKQTGTHGADNAGYPGSLHSDEDDIHLNKMFYEVTIFRVPVNYFHTKISSIFYEKKI